MGVTWGWVVLIRLRRSPFAIHLPNSILPSSTRVPPHVSSRSVFFFLVLLVLSQESRGHHLRKNKGQVRGYIIYDEIGEPSPERKQGSEGKNERVDNTLVIEIIFSESVNQQQIA